MNKEYKDLPKDVKGQYKEKDVKGVWSRGPTIFRVTTADSQDLWKLRSEGWEKTQSIPVEAKEDGTVAEKTTPPDDDKTEPNGGGDDWGDDKPDPAAKKSTAKKKAKKSTAKK